MQAHARNVHMEAFIVERMSFVGPIEHCNGTLSYPFTFWSTNHNVCHKVKMLSQ